jgi:hypothetical protein
MKCRELWEHVEDSRILFGLLLRRVRVEWVCNCGFRGGKALELDRIGDGLELW